MTQPDVATTAPPPPTYLFFGFRVDTPPADEQSVKNLQQNFGSFLGQYIHQTCAEAPEGEKILFFSVLQEHRVQLYGAEPGKKGTEIHYIDQMDVGTRPFGNDVLEERLRLAIALFTIKRHVFKLAQQLGGNMNRQAPKVLRRRPDSGSEREGEEDEKEEDEKEENEKEEEALWDD